MKIAVVGGGVIGLSCAATLAGQGHAVEVVADQALDSPLVTSNIAAAAWSPAFVEQSERVWSWALRSREVYLRLAEDGAPGIRPVRIRNLSRGPVPVDPWHASLMDEPRPVPRADLPAGYAHGVDEVTLGIDMSVYLPWLAGRCRTLDVRLSTGHVARLADLADDVDVVVVAAGLGSGPLLGDTTMTPIRTQVVLLDNPDGSDVGVSDRDHPEGMYFAIPRGDTYVCGAFHEVGRDDLDYEQDREDSVLARLRRLRPDLRDAAVVGRAVGLRPGRTEVSLERGVVDGRRVVTCYGHGGAGVSLAWGSAEEVGRLVAGC